MAAENELTLTVRAADAASATLKKVGDNVRDYGAESTKTLDRAADNTRKSSDLTRQALTGVGLALGGAGVAITAFAKNSTDSTIAYVGSVNKLSREIGENTVKTSELIYAGKRMGLTVDEASTSFGILSKKIVENRTNAAEAAAKHADLANKIQAVQIEIKKDTDEIKKNGDASGELHNKIDGLTLKLKDYQSQLTKAQDPLSKLGVSTVTATGASKDFNDILLDVADKFKTMPNGAEKTAAAMELFGRSGKDLLPLLNQGSDGIKALEAQADKLGLTITAKTVGAVKAYTAAVKDNDDAMQALKLRVGIETLPVLTAFQNSVNGVVNSLLNAPAPIREATTDVLAFGGPVITAAGGVLGFGANLATTLPMIKSVGTELAAGAGKLGLFGIAVAGTAVVLTGFTLGINDLKEKGLVTDQQLHSLGNSLIFLGGPVTQITSSVAGMTDRLTGNQIASWQLKSAHDALKQSLDAEKTSSDALRDAHLTQTAISLQVEQAQRSYNQAVAQYGPASLEARTASNNLAIANRNLDSANRGVANAQDANQQAAHRVADAHNRVNSSSASLRNALNSTKGSVDSSSGSWGNLGNQVMRYINLLFQIPTNPKGILHELHVPGFATGVHDFSGGPAIVGENGPELVYLPQHSSVLTAPQTRQAASGGLGSGVTINQTNYVYNQVDMLQANRELGLRLALS